MAVHWHPLLAQMLRHELGPDVEVLEEVSLGKMPLRADIILIRRPRRRRATLAYPFCHLGERTLLEYVGPGRVAGLAALDMLQVYGLLYQRRRGRPGDRSLSLWLAAGAFARGLLGQPGVHVREVGPGFAVGELWGFPFGVVDLRSLPITDGTLPLVMAAKGKREREVMGFLVERPDPDEIYVALGAMMHPGPLAEAIIMKRALVDPYGLDLSLVLKLAGKERFIQTLGEKVAIETIGREKVIETIGREKFIETFGERQLLEALLRRMGRRKVEALLQGRGRAERKPPRRRR